MSQVETIITLDAERMKREDWIGETVEHLRHSPDSVLEFHDSDREASARIKWTEDGYSVVVLEERLATPEGTMKFLEGIAEGKTPLRSFEQNVQG